MDTFLYLIHFHFNILCSYLITRKERKFIFKYKKYNTSKEGDRVAHPIAVGFPSQSC